MPMSEAGPDPEFDCPLSEEEEAWVEQAARWVLATFGKDFLLSRPILLPTRGFFDRRFDGTEADADHLLIRLCEVMDLDPSRIVLVFHSEEQIHLSEGLMSQPLKREKGVAGHYIEREDGRFEISLETGGLQDTVALIATLSHEMAHVKLLGEKRIEENDEQLTDLLPVFFGLGVFMANGVHRFRTWRGAAYSGWHINRIGYLPQRVFGFALAQWCLYRGDDPKAIAKHLDPNAKAAFEATLLYLEDDPAPT
jgi:hypothetical protein